MPDGPDFRGDKSESAEGQRVTARRRGSFHYSFDEDVAARANWMLGQSMDAVSPSKGRGSNAAFACW
jgi:hypothetical protein